MKQRPISATARTLSASDVADLLRSEIRSSRRGAGTAISEDEAQEAYGVSHTLARRALTALADDGLIVRTRGVGSRVVAQQVSLPLDDLVAASGQVVEVEELSRETVVVSRDVREVIGSPGGEVGMIEHLYLVDGKPIGLRVAYFTAGTPQALRSGPVLGITQAFAEVFRSTLMRIDSTVEAVVCDERTAALLQTAPRSPLLMREQRLVDAQGRTREINFAQYRADLVTFVA